MQSSRFAQISTPPPSAWLRRGRGWTGDGPKSNGTRGKSASLIREPCRLIKLACGTHQRSGYTPGMKTAVSVPDDVFQSAEHLVRRTGMSRSEVYSRALREYVARHAPDEVTQALNDMIQAAGESDASFSTEAARRILESDEW